MGTSAHAVQCIATFKRRWYRIPGKIEMSGAGTATQHHEIQAPTYASREWHAWLPCESGKQSFPKNIGWTIIISWRPLCRHRICTSYLEISARCSAMCLPSHIYKYSVKYLARFGYAFDHRFLSLPLLDCTTQIYVCNALYEFCESTPKHWYGTHGSENCRLPAGSITLHAYWATERSHEVWKETSLRYTHADWEISSTSHARTR